MENVEMVVSSPTLSVHPLRLEVSKEKKDWKFHHSLTLTICYHQYHQVN